VKALFLALKALLKISMPFTDELSKFALLLIRTCPAAILSTRLLAATCHATEPIPCKITESWILQSGLATTKTYCYALVPQILWSIEFLSRVCFKCIGS